MGRQALVSQQFTSAVERLRWAEQDILELKEWTRTFFGSDTHERVSEPDPNSSLYMIDKIRFKARLPREITKLTVSVIENLRASLDHSACAVVPSQFKKCTYFPFGDTRAEFRRHLKSKAKHVPDEIKSVFEGFKPYKRGNPPLWALNKLCNTHKHRTIIQPGVHVKDLMFVGYPPGTALNATLRHFLPRWNRRKNEIVISTMAGDTTSHHDVDL